MGAGLEGVGCGLGGVGVNGVEWRAMRAMAGEKGGVA